MPYSIKTKDGITINNIPDDIEPNSDVLRQRVESIRAERGGEAPAPQIQPEPEVAPQLPVEQAAPPQQEGSVLEAIRGPAEATAALATGALAEPIAGVAGIAQAINPFAEPGAGARAVEATREALTFQPPSEAGQEALRTVGETLEPVTEAITTAETFLGDKTMELTGSPALAAAATTIPTALAEVVGFAGAKGVTKATQRAKEGKITREISEAAPSVEQLKDTSRAVYNEIDNLGVSVKPQAYQELVAKLNIEARKGGLDPTITPKTTQALTRFNDRLGDNVTLTELDTLRKVAQNAAKSIEPAEAALGARLIETVDSFLDSVGPGAFDGPPGAKSGIQKRYKVARDLWGRARRSELLEESFAKARLQASGFENGIRVQFRSILNNKKKSRFFKKDELAAMEKVVKGGKGENIAKLIGRLGFSEGGATNIIGGALGATAGGIVLGTPGAVLVPVIGQVSRQLAQRMTRGNAQFANEVIRAGKDARKITKAYLENTPKAQRNPAELSELLMKTDIDLSTVSDNVVSIEAARIARDKRALAAAAAAGAATPVAAEAQ